MNIKWDNQQPGMATVEVADVTGKVVYRSALNINAAAGEQHIQLNNVADGIYSVTVKSDVINYKGRITVQK